MDRMTTSNEVGARLLNARLARGHGKYTAARTAGVSFGLWTKVEATGHLPRAASAYLIANYLGTSIADLWPQVLDRPRGDQ